MNRPALKIGDVVPMPGPVDRDAVTRVMIRRGLMQRNADHGKINLLVNQARKILDGAAANDARAADAVEQAKRHLRRRGYNVFSGTVLGHPPDMIVVGHKLLSVREMMEFAQRKGWGGVAVDTVTPIDVGESCGRPRETAAYVLLQRIEGYLRSPGAISERHVGRVITGNPNFVKCLRNGTVPRDTTMAKANAWLDGKGVRK